MLDMRKKNKATVTYLARNGKELTLRAIAVNVDGMPRIAVRVMQYGDAPVEYFYSRWESWPAAAAAVVGYYRMTLMGRVSAETWVKRELGFEKLDDLQELGARRDYDAGWVSLFVIE